MTSPDLLISDFKNFFPPERNSEMVKLRFFFISLKMVNRINFCLFLRDFLNWLRVLETYLLGVWRTHFYFLRLRLAVLFLCDGTLPCRRVLDQRLKQGCGWPYELDLKIFLHFILRISWFRFLSLLLVVILRVLDLWYWNIEVS